MRPGSCPVRRAWPGRGWSGGGPGHRADVVTRELAVTPPQPGDRGHQSCEKVAVQAVSSYPVSISRGIPAIREICREIWNLRRVEARLNRIHPCTFNDLGSISPSHRCRELSINCRETAENIREPFPGIRVAVRTMVWASTQAVPVWPDRWFVSLELNSHFGGVLG